MNEQIIENFKESLIIMGKGMAGIFTVILLLTFIVMILALLAKFSKPKKTHTSGEE